jgi:hypothetical protein
MSTAFLRLRGGLRDSFCNRDEFAQLDPQTSGQAVSRSQGRGLLTALDQADVRSVHPGLVREGFLRLPLSSTNIPHCKTERASEVSTHWGLTILDSVEIGNSLKLSCGDAFTYTVVR